MYLICNYHVSYSIYDMKGAKKKIVAVPRRGSLTYLPTIRKRWRISIRCSYNMTLEMGERNII